MNFVDRIISAFSLFAEKNAFCIEDTFYTYKELLLITSSISKKIEAHCGEEQNIGVVVTDCIETYASILAVMLAGRTYIPVHPHHPVDRVMQVIEQAGIKHILAAAGAAAYTNVNLIDTTFNAGDAEAIDYILKATDASFLAKNTYILFTSGSTGVPKGVPITNGNLQCFVDAFFALGYEMNSDDRFLQMFDLTFDLSVMSYLIPLTIGACVYTISFKGMKFTNVYTVLEEHEITFALMVPSILTSLKPYFAEIDLPKLKYSLFCGEALYTDVTREWRKCLPNAIIDNVYGPTEATIFCLTYRVADVGTPADYNGILSIGKEMEGMEAIVVDAENKPLPDNEKGELCLSGGQLTNGYLNSERDKGVFFTADNKRYYRTGDIAFRDEQGNFMYCGRVDHQVKIQGYRVELSEIEFHVRQLTNDTNMVAIAITNLQGISEIHVIFEGGVQSIDEVIANLGMKIPSYMMPTQIHYLDAFPLNSNGKTDRKAIQQKIAAL